MKINSIVLKYIVVFTTLCFANVKSVESAMVNPPLVETKTMVKFAEPPVVLTLFTESSELQETELCYYNSRLIEMGDVNLSFQLKFPTDTINYHDVYFYIKHILPIIKNSENVEMIEIL